MSDREKGKKGKERGRDPEPRRQPQPRPSRSKTSSPSPKPGSSTTRTSSSSSSAVSSVTTSPERPPSVLRRGNDGVYRPEVPSNLRQSETAEERDARKEREKKESKERLKKLKDWVENHKFVKYSYDEKRFLDEDDYTLPELKYIMIYVYDQATDTIGKWRDLHKKAAKKIPSPEACKLIAFADDEDIDDKGVINLESHLPRDIDSVLLAGDHRLKRTIAVVAIIYHDVRGRIPGLIKAAEPYEDIFAWVDDSKKRAEWKKGTEASYLTKKYSQRELLAAAVYACQQGQGYLEQYKDLSRQARTQHPGQLDRFLRDPDSLIPVYDQASPYINFWRMTYDGIKALKSPTNFNQSFCLLAKAVADIANEVNVLERAIGRLDYAREAGMEAQQSQAPPQQVLPYRGTTW